MYIKSIIKIQFYQIQKNDFRISVIKKFLRPFLSLNILNSCIYKIYWAVCKVMLAFWKTG